MGAAVVPVMLASTALAAGVGTVSAVQGAQAQNNMSQYQAALARNNAVIADQAAKDALERGKVAAQAQQEATRQRIGAARARAAGRGVLVDSGSAFDLTQNIAAFGKLDELQLTANAQREAAGFRQQGTNFLSESALQRTAGKNAITAGAFNAAGSLLGGASSVAEKWYTYK